MKNIQLVIGSNGGNLKLANAFKKEIEAQGSKATIQDLVSFELPLYTSSTKLSDTDKEKVNTCVEAFKKCDGFVFISPEYNRGLPPVLTNFTSWISIYSRPTAKRCYSC